MTEARRADATRNTERIIESATACLLTRPDATMTEIARAAELGRVTLYGHFASRAELVDAVTARVLGRSDRALAGIDLGGDPRAGLVRLLHGMWRQLDQSRGILAAATQELSEERIWELHADLATRVDGLIRRGRDEGAFRNDMPATWLLAVLHQIVHGAAEEIDAGRLDADQAPDLVGRTALALFSPDAP